MLFRSKKVLSEDSMPDSESKTKDNAVNQSSDTMTASPEKETADEATRKETTVKDETPKESTPSEGEKG